MFALIGMQKKMAKHRRSQGWVLLSLADAFLLALSLFPCSNAARWNKVETTKTTTTSVFLSPKIELAPGDVKDRYYYQIGFPKGHIGIKSFNAELVDEQGNSVPLYETYLHHWIVIRYYGRIGWVEPEQTRFQGVSTENFTYVRNSGPCQGNVHGQYFGLGSETRRSDTLIPEPYAVEVGNPADVPDGFEERWLLNVHAIDTRGAVDTLGCLECRCDLYNVTVNEFGEPLSEGYQGGLHCCYDGTWCRVKDGFDGEKRNLYMKYTVEWRDWSDSLLPVRIYIADVTDSLKMNYTTGSLQHNCKIEYTVEAPTNGSRTTISNIDNGGYLIYAVSHLHYGGLGGALYGEDGRVLCSSLPIYGNGTEAGNEDGYIVGMSTCYPELGSIKINDGETMIIKIDYDGAHLHTGVMGLIYILVSDYLPNFYFE